MKKAISIFLALCLALSFSACSRSNNAVDVVDELYIDEPLSQLPEPTEEPTPEPTPEPTQEPKNDIEWTTVTKTTTDSDGYTFEITFKLSPWILLSNSEIINYAWQEVSKGNTMPDFNGWGLELTSGNTYFRQGVPRGGTTTYYARRINDMYYCIGTVQIRNITEGWSIDSSNPRSVYATLGWENTGLHDSSAYSIGRVFYSSTQEDQSNEVRARASMSSDRWGPAAFILMTGENFSPNYPDGEYLDDILSGYFISTDLEDVVRIGVYGKGGEYYSPIEE